MTRQLLELPPELLVHILSLLSVQDLLRFSQASRHARSLANPNIHSLSLGVRLIYPNDVIGRVDIKTSLRLGHMPLALTHRLRSSDGNDDQVESSDDTEAEEMAQRDCDPKIIWVRIYQAHLYNHIALLRFHDALLGSILCRHGQILQKLHLCLWTLTTNVAVSIAKLSALRSLSINIDATQCARPTLRHYMAQQRLEQNKAWTVLARNALWTHHVHTLKIENANLNHSQLSNLLHQTRTCEELSLRNCQFIGKELWLLLGSTWRGRATLQRLTVAECGSLLDECSLNAIGQLHGLQVRFS